VIASDSTVGWASAWGLITNARLGAVKESTAIHRRPDPLTVTENKFESMEMVAIKESKDKWLEVVGERRSAKGWKNKSGWIAEASVITDPSEVAIAVLATKAMREKDDTIKQEKLQFLLKNTSNTNSVFIQKIKANLRELKQEE